VASFDKFESYAFRPIDDQAFIVEGAEKNFEEFCCDLEKENAARESGVHIL
jgi:hypothetical protein